MPNTFSTNNPQNTEETIQETIRKEVLKSDCQLQESAKIKEEESINLNVLEDITELPREEIEKIAHKVCQSFNQPDPLQVIEKAHACLQGISRIEFAPNFLGEGVLRKRPCVP